MFSNILSSLDVHIDITSEVEDLKRGDYSAVKRIQRLSHARGDVAADAAILVTLQALKKLLKTSFGVVLSTKGADQDAGASAATSGGAGNLRNGNSTAPVVPDEDAYVALTDLLELLKQFAKGVAPPTSPPSRNVVNKYAKTIFFETSEARLLLQLLVHTADHHGGGGIMGDQGGIASADLLYVRADVFALLAVLQRFYPKRLEESLLQTPLVFQVLLETLRQSSAFVRNECLQFVKALLGGSTSSSSGGAGGDHGGDGGNSNSIIGNILIMQGLFEYLLSEEMPDLNGVDALEESLTCPEILALLLRSRRGRKYLREAELCGRLWRLFGNHFLEHLDRLCAAVGELTSGAGGGGAGAGGSRSGGMEMYGEGGFAEDAAESRRKFKTCESLLDVISVFLVCPDEEEAEASALALLRVPYLLQNLVEALFLSLRQNVILARKLIDLLTQIAFIGCAPPASNGPGGAANTDHYLDHSGAPAHSTHLQRSQAGGSSSSTSRGRARAASSTATRSASDLKPHVQSAIFSQLVRDFEPETAWYYQSSFYTGARDSYIEDADAGASSTGGANRALHPCPCGGGALIYGLVNLLLLCAGVNCRNYGKSFSTSATSPAGGVNELLLLAHSLWMPTGCDEIATATASGTFSNATLPPEQRFLFLAYVRAPLSELLSILLHASCDLGDFLVQSFFKEDTSLAMLMEERGQGGKRHNLDAGEMLPDMNKISDALENSLDALVAEMDEDVGKKVLQKKEKQLQAEWLRANATRWELPGRMVCKLLSTDYFLDSETASGEKFEVLYFALQLLQTLLLVRGSRSSETSSSAGGADQVDSSYEHSLSKVAITFPEERAPLLEYFLSGFLRFTSALLTRDALRDLMVEMAGHVAIMEEEAAASGGDAVGIAGANRNGISPSKQDKTSVAALGGAVLVDLPTLRQRNLLSQDQEKVRAFSVGQPEFAEFSELVVVFACLETVAIWSNACSFFRRQIQDHATLVVVRLLELLQHVTMFANQQQATGSSSPGKPLAQLQGDPSSTSENQIQEESKLLLLSVLTQWLPLCPEIFAQLSAVVGGFETIHGSILSLRDPKKLATCSTHRFRRIVQRANLGKIFVKCYLSERSKVALGGGGEAGAARSGATTSSGAGGGKKDEHLFILEEFKDSLRAIEQECHGLRNENLKLRDEIALAQEERNTLAIRGEGYSALYDEEGDGNCIGDGRQTQTQRRGAGNGGDGAGSPGKFGDPNKRNTSLSATAGTAMAGGSGKTRFGFGKVSPGRRHANSRRNDSTNGDQFGTSTTGVNSQNAWQLSQNLTPAFLLGQCEKNLTLLRGELAQRDKIISKLQRKVSDLKKGGSAAGAGAGGLGGGAASADSQNGLADLLELLRTLAEKHPETVKSALEFESEHHGESVGTAKINLHPLNAFREEILPDH